MNPAAALALLLFACSREGDTPPPADTLVVALAQEPANVLPGLAVASTDLLVADALSMPLFESDFACGVKHTPALARAWSWSADGKVLSMELRDDVKWSDGAAVTAHDVAFAAKLLVDPVVGSSLKTRLAHLEPDACPRVVDDTHLEWRFTHVYDREAMLSHVDVAPLPRHLLEGVAPKDLREHAQNVEAPGVTSGPFALASWSRGEELVLKPNPAFSGPPERRPRLDRVVLRVLPDPATRLLQLESGEVDLVEGLPIGELAGIAERHPEIRILRRGWRSMDWIAWNNRDPAAWKAAGPEAAAAGVAAESVAAHPLFGDRELRRALTLAVPVEKLIDDLLTSPTSGEVYGRPAVGVVTPALCRAHADDLTRLPFDPAAARARLAELGWTDPDGDGTVDREGVPLRFTMLVPAANARRAAAAVILQQAFATVGVDVVLETVEPSAFFARVKRHDFDAALFGWSAQLNVDPSSVLAPDGAYNSVGYVNPDVPVLVKKGLEAEDPATAAAVWRDLQRRVYEDQPYTFLYWLDEPVAVHGRFQDTTIDVLAPWRQLWRWSVPPEKVKYK